MTSLASRPMEWSPLKSRLLRSTLVTNDPRSHSTNVLTPIPENSFGPDEGLDEDVSSGSKIFQAFAVEEIQG